MENPERKIKDREATVVVYTCDDCEREWFPDGTVSKIHDAHIAIVHEWHIGQYLNNGFQMVEGIVQGTDIPGVFCPHL